MFITSIITDLILQAKEFLKCDWLRPVVFEPNLKYLHVKITVSNDGELNDRNNMAEIFPKCDGKKLQELKEITKNANNKERTKIWVTAWSIKAESKGYIDLTF